MHRARVAARTLCAIAVVASAGAAGPLVPTRPSQLVTVRALRGGSQPCPIDPTGDLSESFQIDLMANLEGPQRPLVIPDENVLVITHVHLTPEDAPANIQVKLAVVAITGTELGVLAETDANTNADGFASADLDLPSGIAVRRGQPLCAAAGRGTSFGTVSGFFAKAR
jgi:hypothetical protein